MSDISNHFRFARTRLNEKEKDLRGPKIQSLVHSDCRFYTINYIFMEVELESSSLVAQMVKNPPAIQETWVWSLGQKDPLKKGMTTRSSILACRIPWTEELGGLQSMDFQESDMTERLTLTSCRKSIWCLQSRFPHPKCAKRKIRWLEWIELDYMTRSYRSL